MTNWIKVSEKLPEPFETVWLWNGKDCITLGCLVETPEGWHWAESNGSVYACDGKIIAECDGDDLDVIYWHRVPDLIL